MHFLMTALGSYGDVYPIVGLGRALAERGHTVSVICNPHFQGVIESAGLELVPIGTVADYERLAELPEMWHRIRGPMLVMKEGVAGMVRELYGLVEANYRPGETVLAAHCLDMASRVFQDKHGAPLASLFFAPLAFRSFHQSPRMGTMLLGPGVPVWLRRLQFWMADRLFVDRCIGPEINGLRRELGLPPVKRFLHHWYFSPQLVLGLFPEWFARPQPDWPTNVRLTGFPLWDEPDEAGLPDEVEQFLADGERPIVFTPGSAMAHGGAFFETAVEACHRLGRRGMLLSRYAGHVPRNLPAKVRHFEFAPFSQLLPRVAAVVHHGGIGSCGQGLAAGVPQLVMPMAYDQFDNGERLKRLGVASVLPTKRFRGPAVAQELGKLLDDSATRENCNRYAAECDASATLARSCDWMESLADQ